MSSQLNEIRLQLERLDYENKEGKIAFDILQEQNQDLKNEIEDLQKNITEVKSTSKDAAAAEDKERKKAEKMALMMSKFDAVSLDRRSEVVEVSADPTGREEHSPTRRRKRCELLLRNLMPSTLMPQSHRSPRRT